ncbi:hypothetical protein [Bremerella alba]|uniref:Uncharacterized protein n=1 Tax=Bremerella alba TaxID=980252 RepID=A0A7V9A688_9BACT|nr:hypothetical protein [Bremerella alba]MBA2113691.1 hypothetical protein [Bremerella alba]
MIVMETLKAQIVEYSEANEYVATHFATAVCNSCSGDVFELLMNEEEGVAARICVTCDEEHGIGDSDQHIAKVEEIFDVLCTCDGTKFRIMAAVSLSDDSEDVRWFYLGCKCVECGLSGVYGDWKNEFHGYQVLLDNV